MKRLLPALVFLLIAPGCAVPDVPPAASMPRAAGNHGATHGSHRSHGVHQPIGHRFDDAENWVARFEGPERDAWQNPDHVVDLLDLKTGMTVVDLGAGTGYFLPRLSAAVGDSGSVVGVDIEPSMVDYMKLRATREQLTNVEIRLARSTDPGLIDASVDRVLIVDTWHHIPERGVYARTLAKALRIGGSVYVVDFTMDTPHGPPREHRLLPDQVVKELESGGLDAMLITEELEHQYVVRGIRP